ncbi:hypothetical protein V1503_23765 [Bacillus sp. SCS-151]|uniref:hypothetical protein n=1 Tax=Nanhaiella sioensis TaxID=3115293 RepID=UPI00397C15AD
MVLIKIKEVPSSREALKERVRRAWRINPNRLYNQDQAIAVHKGEVLEVYKILGYTKDAIEPDRVAFELEEMESDLKGKHIVSRTSNPCTIVDSLDFK